jgi:formyl-CoA transferase
LKAAGAQYEELQGLYQSSRVQPPGNVYYRVYQTRDGFISVGCMSDRLRKRLLDVLGLRDIRFEPGYDATTPEARSFGTQLTKEAEAKFREKGTEEWIHVLDSAGIPCGPFLFPEELMEHPQVQANNLTVEFQHRQVGRVFMVGPFLDMERSPLEVWHPSPTLGEHTEEVLAGLGYTREQVEELRQQGVTR